ncbi:MAG TPA: glycosyltransferase family 4 protein [Burkholderiales bacterium]|nr:glycosyltransferase family 4 protein [Burkholderiales bacterium]
MHLLLVSQYYSTHGGGVEAVAHRLAEALLERMPGLAIRWIASDCDAVPRDLHPRLGCDPAPAWNGLERRLGVPYPFWSPRAMARLWRAVREADAVHVHESVYIGSLLAYVFARCHRKPVVVTQHVGEIAFNRRALRVALALLNRSFGRMLLSGADRAFFISPQVRDYFARFCRFRAPPAYVPNGVDGVLYACSDAAQVQALKHGAGRDPQRPLCLFVGRFVPRKGIDLVLAMARSLPGVDWILAGNGVLRPEDAGLGNVSVLRGRSGAQIAALYRLADLLVLPSTGEGFPLVVQEALACGTPALVSPATAQGCPPAGPFLFTEDLPEKGAAESWARRVNELLADPKLLSRRTELAQAARRLRSWEGAAEPYLAALCAICGDSRVAADG